MPVQFCRRWVMTVHFDTLIKGNAVDVVAAGDETGAAEGMYRSVGKRLLDTTLVLLTAPVWLVLIGAIAIALVVAGQRPFFMQQRLGQNGRIFRIIKFRTMVLDADSALSRHIATDPAARAEWDAHQKLKNDPRITPLGSFLRRTSLDELPQLLNVLVGDMSLVGPRPMMVDQRAMYPGSAYFELRPGITGPWQVSDRNSCEFWERAEYDTRYSVDVSLRHDVGLLFDTVGVVIRGTGY